jgi:hypothetical protein
MRPPPNWWSLTGLILNFVGTIVLLWYSKQWLSITPAGSLRVTFGTWATSPWWWYAGLGLNILGFLCQLISNICGVTRRAPPQTASRFPFRWCGTKPTVSGISQLDEPRCGVKQGYSPRCLKTKVLISADLRRSDTVDLRPHWRKQNDDAVCRARGPAPECVPPRRHSRRAHTYSPGSLPRYTVALSGLINVEVARAMAHVPPTRPGNHAAQKRFTPLGDRWRGHGSAS